VTRLIGFVSLSTVLALAAVAQQDSPASYTPARRHEIRRSVQLPGTVESLTSSIVAAETQGSVVAVEVRPGDRVDAGTPLLRLRTRWSDLQLSEARGRRQEAEARLELARSKLTRARDLFANEVISQQDLDDAVSEYTAWEGRDSQSRAEVERLEFAVDRLVVRAPFDGVVTAKLTDLGEWVPLGGPVVEMVAMGRLEIRVEVPERYFDELQPGVIATVRFEALPGLILDGRVSAIIPSADLQARTFPIKVSLPDSHGRVGVGMLARVDLPVGDRFDAVIVPKDAVVRQGSRDTVLKLNGANEIEPAAVQTGQGAGAWIVVEGPIAAGDRVVTRGNERLRPGQSVEATLREYPLP
jgi:RND family efflux transporter MFP subunit